MIRGFIAIVLVVFPLLSVAPCAIVSVIQVQRSYSGRAQTTSPPTTNTSILDETASGLGALAEVAVTSSGGGGVAFAVGLAASASQTNSLITLETGSRAVHNTVLSVLANPSFGEATATVDIDALVELSASARALLFEAAHTSSGSQNSGVLTFTSDIRGELFTSDLSAVPSQFTIGQIAGETISIDLTAISSSYRGRGPTIGLPVTDTDSQQFSLNLVSAVPEPSSVAFGLLACGYYCFRARKRWLAN